MQQATVNLFADMSVQPGSLRRGLDRREPRLPTPRRPVRRSMSPAGRRDGAARRGPRRRSAARPPTAVASSAAWRFRSTAAPRGMRRRRAGAGRTTWTPSSAGHHGDQEPRGGRQRQPRDAGPGHDRQHLRAPTCPCSIWDSVDDADRCRATTIRSRSRRACKFRAAGGRLPSPACGSTRERRIPAPHIGHLWSSTGALLARRPSPTRRASGWQQRQFPVAGGRSPPTPPISRRITAASGHCSVDGQLFRDVGTRESAAAGARRTARTGQRRLSVRAPGAFPTETFERRTTGSMWNSPRRG